MGRVDFEALGVFLFGRTFKISQPFPTSMTELSPLCRHLRWTRELWTDRLTGPHWVVRMATFVQGRPRAAR